MNNYKQAKEFYDYIIKNNGYSNMSMVWTISCIEESLQAYDMDLIMSDSDKEKMCNLVLESWLKDETNTSISMFSDIVVEHWDKLKDKDMFNAIQDILINYIR